ncbi:MAG: hypothetical protein U0V75_00110 [Ferruginibacter sp.]
MKQLIIVFTFLIAACSLNAQGFYSFSVPKIEGGNQSINSYQNKMVLIITLPVQQGAGNDSLLHSIDSLGAANNSSLQIIAVPSYEDGFSAANRITLMNWYRSQLNASIVITDGLYTRQSSGSQQHPLFQWLTDKDKNGHLDIDVTGPRMKFFIWTDGILTGVLGAQTKLGGAAMQGLLNGQ